jgi:hypothetical protein
LPKIEPAASGKLIELATTVLQDPDDPPREVSYLAVVLAWVAWNRSVGLEVGAESLAGVSAQLESAPDLRRSFKYRKMETLLKHLQKEKERRYPKDLRQILSCTMSKEGVVRAEWIDMGPS